MKIAFVVGNFPTISQTFILNQLSGLIDLGHEVDILSFDQGDGLPVHPIVQKYNLLSRTIYLYNPLHKWTHRFVKGDPIFWKHFLRSPSRTVSSLNVFRFGRRALSLQLLYQMDYLSARAPYDVIHCQFGTLGLKFMPLYHLGAGRKMIVQFRGYDISQFVLESGENVYRPLFKYVDYFLTNCEFFKKRLIGLGCPIDKVAVVYSGIDLSRFTYQERVFPEQGPVKIAMIGRLVDKKGTEFALKAVASLIKKGYLLQFLIIGDGPLMHQLSELCHDISIENHVNFMGPKDQTQIIDILKGAHLFLAPSVKAQNGDEDAPVNVLKEAMAMGMPVVSTWHGGIPELVEDGVSGFLVPERDAQALADKIEWLILHPESWKAIGMAGRACVEKKFNMVKLNQQLSDIYSAVAGN